MKFHGSLQFPRLNAKKNNGPILHFALRKLEKLNQGNFLLAGIWYRPKITQYTVALKLYPGCLQTLSFTLPLSPLSPLSSLSPSSPPPYTSIIPYDFLQRRWKGEKLLMTLPCLFLCFSPEHHTGWYKTGVVERHDKNY